MATIKDVAREAGVSLGTVSNVLNKKAGVKTETKEKVHDAIDRLGFRYNMNASALRTGATKNIGLIIPTIVNPYYPELARGVEDALRKENFTLFLCNSDRNIGKERQYVNALLSKGADGLILVKSKLPEEELRQLAARTLLVLVDHDGENSQSFCSVNVDDDEGITQGMALLEQYGHEQIAFISGLEDAYSSMCRIKSFRKCLKQRNLECRQEYMVNGDFSWNSGYVGAKQLLSLAVPPTAIFAANDIMAIGAIRAILDSGKRIPEDISVLGYDDIEMGKFCMPTLTTVHQPKYQVGTEAVKLLLKEVNKETIFDRCILMNTRVVMRESVASPARSEHNEDLYRK